MLPGTEEFHLYDQVGGTPAVLKLLLEKGMVDGSCMTVTGGILAMQTRPRAL